jgi:pyruvate dehydrogenase E1 component beta subunit
LQAWFAHVPGLKVVMPASAADAKGLLLSSIFDDNPVVFLEHRWLHNLKGEVPAGDYRVPIGKANRVREGTDVTVVATSYMTIEAVHAVDHLATQGVSCELLDLRTIRPLDWAAIEASVRRTGRLLALDTGFTTGGVAGEVVSHVATTCWKDLRAAPRRLAMPDIPEATSPALTKSYHVRAEHIAQAIVELAGRHAETRSLAEQRKHPHDVPGDWFTGPF